MPRDDTEPSEYSELDRDRFLRQMVRDLAGTLEDVVGLEAAKGFLALTGQRMAQMALEHSHESLGDSPTTSALGDFLCDFKKRIQGDFYIVEASEDRVILGNRACPFGVHVEGRPSLCMMTSNVFGTIAADNFGYARITLEDTIAQGDKECRIVVELSPNHVENSGSIREYFR